MDPSGYPVLSDLNLILQIIKSPSQLACVTELSGDDAQCVADLLSEVETLSEVPYTERAEYHQLLHEDGAFSSDDGKHLLSLLQRLVKSAQVLPRCYELQEIRCDFSQAREGGSFADVFQGEYREQKVCVKAVRIFQRGDNTRMLKAFAKEIVLWAHLSHENILPFYGMYQGVSGRICIISPWVDMGDLSAYLQSFPHRPRLPLVLDVTAGLQYLHQSEIVHGDLKAKNILVSEHGRALIADFGISRIVGSTKLASTQFSSGTMRWMAPELLIDENYPPVTLQSDIWSLGCVYYEVFTRKVPFYRCASEARLSLIRLDPKAIPHRPTDGLELDYISDDMWRLMEKCWDNEPCSRPSCTDVYASITGLLRVGKQRSTQHVALWKAVRGRSEIEATCERARRILFRIRHDNNVHHSIASGAAIRSGTINLYRSESAHQCLAARLHYASSDSGSTDTFYTANSFADMPSVTQATDASIFAEDDIVIVIMGPTGVGKSTLFNVMTDSVNVQSGHMCFFTPHIRATRCHDPHRLRDVVFVDTPGLSDSSRSCIQIFAEISAFLEKTYRSGVQLSGILYLHRITDNRMTSTHIRDLDTFLSLCGHDALPNVRLVTTHWDKLKDHNRGIKHEGELRKNYWGTLLSGGSQMHRFDFTCSSAWQIINSLPMEGKVIRIQEELVDQHKFLQETSAARSLLSWVHRAVEALKDLICRLEELKKINSTHNSGYKGSGRDSGNEKVEKQLKRAREVLKNLEKDKSQFCERHYTNDSSYFSGASSSDSASTASTWHYVARQISGRSRRSMKRRPRYTPTLPTYSEFSEAESSEHDSDDFCDPPGPRVSWESLSPTIQRLQAMHARNVQGTTPGCFEDVVEGALKISETLSEMHDIHPSFSSLLENVSQLYDKCSPETEYSSSIAESLENIHRQLASIQDIVTRLKNRKPDPETSFISLDDQHAITECREAVTSALHEMKIS